jgi:hypothetical protein
MFFWLSRKVISAFVIFTVFGCGFFACSDQPVERRQDVANGDKGEQVTGSHLRVRDRRNTGVVEVSPEAMANAIKPATSPSGGSAP